MSENEVIEEQKNSAVKEKRETAENVTMQSLEVPIENEATHRVGEKKTDGNKKHKTSRSVSIFSCVRKNAKEDYTERCLERIASLESKVAELREEFVQVTTGLEEEKKENTAVAEEKVTQLKKERDELAKAVEAQRERAEKGIMDEKESCVAKIKLLELKMAKTNAEWEKEKTTITAELRAAQDTIRTCAEANEDERLEKGGCLEKIKQLESELVKTENKWEKEKKAAEEKADRFEKELESLRTKLGAEEEENKRQEAEVATMKAQRDAAQKKRNEALEQAGRAEAERTAQTKAMKDLFRTPVASREALDSLRRDARFEKIPSDLRWFIDWIRLPERPRVFLDININGQAAGRIVMELYCDTAPKTAENFRALCTGENNIGKRGTPLHYKGRHIHQVHCGGIAGGGGGG